MRISWQFLFHRNNPIYSHTVHVAQRELHTIKGEIIRIETGTIICLLASKVNIDKNTLLFIFSANVFHQMKVQPLAFKKNLYRIINMLTHHFLKLT